jgi:arylsulfatase A
MNILRRIALVLLSLSSLAGAKPNIIFILSDDLAQGDVGAYGQKIIQTPAPRSNGRRRNTVQPGLLRHFSLRSQPGLADDRTSFRPLPDPRQLGDQITRAETPARRNRHRRGDPEIRRLRHRVVGKWGMGFFDTTGSPLKKGFDRFFGYNCQRHAHSYFPEFLWDNDQADRSCPATRENKNKPMPRTSSRRKRSISSALTRQSLLPLLRHHPAARKTRNRRPRNL